MKTLWPKPPNPAPPQPSRQQSNEQSPCVSLQFKQLDGQHSTSQPVEHGKQEDQNRPQCRKPQQQKGRCRKNQCKILYTKKIDRRLWTCGIKQLAPCLKIVSCPIQRLRCAHCLNHSGSRAAKQKCTDEQPAIFLPGYLPGCRFLYRRTRLRR